jgi:excinuclease ABC subunit B
MHAGTKPFDRVRVLQELRSGEISVLVGVNLLREGLDLPEVSLVAVLDADKEGFLRSTTALVQTVGRAARHVEGRAILYADRVTHAMHAAIEETNRRRVVQQAYNEVNGITPRPVERQGHVLGLIEDARRGNGQVAATP